MTREEIVEMAREANIKQAIETPHLLMVHELERFAALVAAHERKAFQHKPLTDEQTETIIEEISGWSWYVDMDTAPCSLEKHVRKVFAAHGINA
jgi:hypothetical protein